jgi:hypothetical protein
MAFADLPGRKTGENTVADADYNCTFTLTNNKLF